MNAATKKRLSSLLLIMIAVVTAVTTSLVLRDSGGWPRETAWMGGIFVLAALLWVSEALPLFATALLVIGLQLVFLANPGGWEGYGFSQGESPSYRSVIAAAADPVLLLFFGGFLMARAAVKEGVDSAMSSLLLKPFGKRPLLLVLGLMSVTCLFGMWMSNTAVTTMMLALIVPILAQVPKSDPYRRLLILSVPVAAAISGISTPISSPPNAVAIGFLQQAGFKVQFLDWMLVALPLAAILLIASWGFLCWFLFPKTKGLRIAPSTQRLTGRGWFVVVVFTVTVLLWMTDQWHGLPAAIVALLPAVVLTASGILNRDDVNGIEWNILILIAGGISLGSGMQLSGLDQELVKWLPVSGGSQLALVALMVGVMLLFGTFMSNTAAANLLLPIGVSSAMAIGGDAPVVVAVAIALSASFAMALPVSTPPNAIAYATGEISLRDMVISGVVIGVVACVLVALFTGPVLRFWGIVG